ncbi:branched-chain amino acid transport system II carrier protein [Aquibacillus albus]|uniref:Branched-chain amino acid transport system carrier protein n=1 Tax=Aquibacillus albus TaxID=1168171 RepID=A0ABS2MXB7_9BACI|nr:branched-chain amino acid transport system II carrier protein [Aquibacillus albus]MBM7570530.1 LIVCS family branched-chain amino acid:cation transporter [Aquibacillus albus]
MNRHTFFIGFMLFALFFGAGNLIYPPTLGIEAGTSYWSAMTGFIITGVGLPILAIAAIAVISDKTTEIGHQINPTFGIIFSSIIYLAIGPFFGIPRAANVAFEMGAQPFMRTYSNTALTLALFTIPFFIAVYFLSLYPSKLVNHIGRWLTPILVVAIAALSIGGIFLLNTNVQAPGSKYETYPFFTGFVEGYLTMDAIAALAFGIIVVTAFKNAGLSNRKDMVVSTIKAGIISGIALTLVYSSIGWVGAKMDPVGTFDNGGQVLSTASEIVFGLYGKVLLGVIVALACLTTSIGLTVACGQYFSQRTNMDYRPIIRIVTIASLVIANLGLTQIISISVPVLSIIYPIAIVLIILTIFQASQNIQRLAVLFTAVISIYQGLTAFQINLAAIDDLIEMLPLYTLGLAWIVPAIIGGGIGWVLDHR